MATTQPIRDMKQAQALAQFFEKTHPRNHLLVSLLLNTALRISDILKISYTDVYKNGKPKTHLTITEKKTNKSTIIALNEKAVAALNMYYPHATPNAPLILNPRTGRAISRVQAHRIITKAAAEVEIEQKVSCHSLRKTFGYQAWIIGTPPALIMEIYNHTSYATTKRYLGITQDHKNALYMNLKF